MIYFDYNATTPMRPEAIAALTNAHNIVGNPSSVHKAGRAARQTLEVTRRTVAETVNASPNQIIFTSGGTESNGLALAAAQHILVGATEHDCVLEASRHFDPNLSIVPVCNDGQLNWIALDALLSSKSHLDGTCILSVMLANNETGVIHPIPEISSLAHEYGWWVHCDAVQAIGKIPVNMQALGVDSLTLSAHKFGGPKGVGALVHKKLVNIVPTSWGGGQEKRRRAGTENVAGIAAMGAALKSAYSSILDMNRVDVLRQRLEQRMLYAVPDAIIYGYGTARLPNTTCIGVPGLRNEMQLMHMDLADVAVGSGSACSSGKVTPSHVLKAMGAPDDAATETLRFSIGWETTETEVDIAANAWVQMVNTARSRVA